jgi:hypothetical protein
MTKLGGETKKGNWQAKVAIAYSSMWGGRQLGEASADTVTVLSIVGFWD